MTTNRNKHAKKIKNVVFLGRKAGSALALQYLVNKGLKVKLVFGPEKEAYQPSLRDTANKNKISYLTDEKKLYEKINSLTTDLVISYLFWKRMRTPLIQLGKFGCINFHPAPLPDYKSRAGYNTAILDARNSYGVSVHYVDSEKFDAGPIIRVARFSIDHKTETAFLLEKKTQYILLNLFKETMDLFMSGKEIKTFSNQGGLYLTAKQLEELKEIKSGDSAEKVNRLCRAFFFPPYDGAHIVIDGQKFTLVNQEILDFIAKHLNQSINHNNEK